MLHPISYFWFIFCKIAIISTFHTSFWQCHRIERVILLRKPYFWNFFRANRNQCIQVKAKNPKTTKFLKCKLLLILCSKISRNKPRQPPPLLFKIFKTNRAPFRHLQCFCVNRRFSRAKDPSGVRQKGRTSSPSVLYVSRPEGRKWAQQS